MDIHVYRQGHGAQIVVVYVCVRSWTVCPGRHAFGAAAANRLEIAGLSSALPCPKGSRAYVMPVLKSTTVYAHNMSDSLWARARAREMTIEILRE